MNQVRFRMDVEREPGALERVLGVIRRRGLDLEHLDVTIADPRTWTVAVLGRLSVADADLALRQLTSLTNVRLARIEEE
ncbi:MAG TPA: ACT domain-containing protein [Candidatus Saccharimonadales bacterium]|nr:ACT domain-containing protein [Candidatus Saccharimonadales bacterium]